MQPIEIKIPQIQWFNNGEKPNEELDKLSLQRFNIELNESTGVPSNELFESNLDNRYSFNNYIVLFL